MIVPAHWRVAVASLRSTPVRTSLTTLGIVIGVASITIVLSLGEGIRQTISRRIADTQATTLSIQPSAPIVTDSLDRLNPYMSLPTSTVTENDYASIVDTPGVKGISPIVHIPATLTYPKSKLQAPVIATSADLPGIIGVTLRSGQFIDNESNATIALGNRLATRLLGTDNASGQQVTIRGKVFTVIGVLKATNNPYSITGVDVDQSAFVSLAAGHDLTGGQNSIPLLLVKIDSEQKIASASAALEKKLTRNHSGDQDFSITKTTDVAQKQNPAYDAIVGATTIIAVISLVVGGVGIMNIMLVSVTERTREIGIRKAIGATQGQIRGQFLTEAVAMTLMGGVIGLIVAYVASYAIGLFISIQPAINYSIVGIALGLALVTGLTFGLFPAIKASRKDPIEALRHYE